MSEKDKKNELTLPPLPEGTGMDDSLDISELFDNENKNVENKNVEDAVNNPTISEKTVEEAFDTKGKDKKAKDEIARLKAEIKQLTDEKNRKEIESKEKSGDANGAVEAFTRAIQSLVDNKKTDSLTPSRTVQKVLADANKQAIKNLENFRKKLAMEAHKGDVMPLYISPSFKTHLPTFSTMTNGKKDKSFFEIGYNGILFKFEIGVKYPNVPMSVYNFIQKKIPTYIAVVSGGDSTKIQEVGFSMRDNSDL